MKNVVQLTFERTYLHFYFKPSSKSFPETGEQAVDQRLFDLSNKELKKGEIEQLTPNKKNG